jgi:hypothetical protein
MYNNSALRLRKLRLKNCQIIAGIGLKQTNKKIVENCQISVGFGQKP